MPSTNSITPLYEVMLSGSRPDFVMFPYGTEYSVGEARRTLTKSEKIRTVKDMAGWRAPSPYSLVASEHTDVMGSFEETKYVAGEIGPVQKITANGCLARHWGLTLPMNDDTCPMPGSNDTNRAVVECLNKVRNQQINLALTFAERQKTVDLVTDRATKIFRAYSRARRKDFRGAAKMLGIEKSSKTNAKSWLELQYGWMPLLSDIYGAHKELTGRRSSKGLLFNVERTISNSGSSSATYEASNFTRFQNNRYDQKTKVSLWYTVQYPALADAGRLGLLNPLEVAWELVPFSFVVDWMLPVGNLLGAMTATAGVTFKSGTLTRSTRGTKVNNYVATSSPMSGGEAWERTGSGQSSATYFRMERQVYTNAPIPLPYVKNPFSVGHALNALALLRGLFK